MNGRACFVVDVPTVVVAFLLSLQLERMTREVGVSGGDRALNPFSPIIGFHEYAVDPEGCGSCTFCHGVSENRPPDATEVGAVRFHTHFTKSEKNPRA